MVIEVGKSGVKRLNRENFDEISLQNHYFFSRYPSSSPFEHPDTYKCCTFSESYGSRETRKIKISSSKFDLEARGILSSLWTQTGP